MKELKTRSAVKSILWRLLGILILGGVTFFYTNKWIQTSLITFIHHFVFLFVFYFHERIWQKIKHPINATGRSLVKMGIYEIFLGNIILGTITYLITGNVKQMGAITITYISIKCLVYILNEFVWKRIKLGVK